MHVGCGRFRDGARVNFLPARGRAQGRRQARAKADGRQPRRWHAATFVVQRAGAPDCAECRRRCLAGLSGADGLPVPLPDAPGAVLSCARRSPSPSAARRASRMGRATRSSAATTSSSVATPQSSPRIALAISSIVESGTPGLAAARARRRRRPSRGPVSRRVGWRPASGSAPSRPSGSAPASPPLGLRPRSSRAGRHRRALGSPRAPRAARPPRRHRSARRAPPPDRSARAPRR